MLQILWVKKQKRCQLKFGKCLKTFLDGSLGSHWQIKRFSTESVWGQISQNGFETAFSSFLCNSKGHGGVCFECLSKFSIWVKFLVKLVNLFWYIYPLLNFKFPKLKYQKFLLCSFVEFYVRAILLTCLIILWSVLF